MVVSFDSDYVIHTESTIEKCKYAYYGLWVLELYSPDVLLMSKLICGRACVSQC